MSSAEVKNMNIKEKVVIVTGASSGIGRATAILLTKHSANVALVARSKEKLENLSGSLAHSFVRVTDMANETEVKEMVKDVAAHYGRIDVLINNAGIGYDALIENIQIDTYRQLFNVDVIGPLIAMQHVIPIMRSQKEGMIINISSGTSLMALPNMGAYSSLKRALVGISLTAREELLKENIKISVVYPYITLTEFEQNTINTKADKEEKQDPFHPPDTAEYVAEKILEGIQSEEAEIFAHEWMTSIK